MSRAPVNAVPPVTGSALFNINVQLECASYTVHGVSSDLVCYTAPLHAPQPQPADEYYDYVWQFEDNAGNWIEFGSRTSCKLLGPNIFKSVVIEQIYQTNIRCYPISDQSSIFALNFDDKFLVNVCTGRKKQVRRVHVDDMGTRDVDQVWSILPPYWEGLDTVSDWRYTELFSVAPTSPEIRVLVDEIKSKLPHFKINEICRVQTLHLMRSYQIRKESLIKSFKVEYIEKILYHGTELCRIDDIISENIDWRRCEPRSQGAVFGTHFMSKFDAAVNYSIENRKLSTAPRRGSANGPHYRMLNTASNTNIPPGTYRLPPPALSAPPIANPRNLTPFTFPNYINRTSSNMPGNTGSRHQTRPEDLTRGKGKVVVVVARVLIGKTRVATDCFVTPNCDRYTDTGVLIDTVVNAATNPTQYVKYHLQEFYPEYFFILDRQSK